MPVCNLFMGRPSYINHKIAQWTVRKKKEDNDGDCNKEALCQIMCNSGNDDYDDDDAFVCCRESVPRQVSQPHSWRVRATSGALYRPDGVLSGTVCARRVWEGDVAAAGVRRAHLDTLSLSLISHAPHLLRLSGELWIMFPLVALFLDTGGGADSRAVSHSTVVQEVSGSNPGAAEKCWAVMELFVNIYLYELFLSLLCVRVRCFGLYWLSYSIEVNLALFYGYPYRAA